MRTRAAAWLARSLAGLSLAMFLASITLYFLARSAHVPSSWGASTTLGDLLFFLPFLASPSSEP